MRTAIFGGSFNPVHRGHLALASAVISIGFESVMFVPAKQPPHKRLADGASSEDGMMMLRLVVDGLSWGAIWPGEMDRSGPSYTIDTVRELKREGLIVGRPGLIIGDDLAEGFSKWKEAGELAAETEIILARRREVRDVSFSYPHRRLENPIWRYSSSEVRRLIAEKQSIEELVPDTVAAYIRSKSLYGI